MKRVFVFFSVVAMVIAMIAPVGAVHAADTPEFTQEEFMEILGNADLAARFYTQPEYLLTNDRLSSFLQDCFSMSGSGKKDGYNRLTGGLARPDDFMYFLRQYFSEEVINGFNGEHFIFDLEEDQVYWLCVGAIQHGDSTSNYTITEFGPERVVCRLDIAFEDFSEELNNVQFDYVYEKTDGGKWVFTTFATKDELYDLQEKKQEAAAGNDSADGDISAAPFMPILICFLTAGTVCGAAVGQKNKKRVFLFLLAAMVTVNFAGCVKPASGPEETAEAATNDVSLATDDPAAANTAEPTAEPTFTSDPEDIDHLNKNITSGDWVYDEAVDSSGKYGGTKVASVIKYTGSDAEVTVPEKLNGLYVAVIKNGTFADNPNAGKIKALTLAGRTRLADKSLSGLSGLSEVTVADNDYNWTGLGADETESGTIAANIKKITVSDAVSAGNIWNGLTELETIVFANSPASIAEGAFAGLKSLKTVEGLDKLETIPKEAFKDCVSFDGRELLKTVKRIGDSAFSGCKAIEGELVIPENLEFIGNGAFSGCSGITKVVWNNENCKVGTEGTAEDGTEKFAYASLVSGMSGLETIEVAAGIRSIQSRLFSRGGSEGSVKTLILPDSLESIGDGAFMGCALSGTVTLPEKVNCIPAYCFTGCSYLNDISIHSGVERIEDGAFSSCSNLSAVNLPEGLKSVGERVFNECYSLKTVKLPDSLESLGAYVFRNCDRLTSAELPASITALPEGCFFGCASIEKVSYPYCVKVGSRAFYMCPNLAEVNFAANAELGDNVFGFCFALYPDVRFDIP